MVSPITTVNPHTLFFSPPKKQNKGGYAVFVNHREGCTDKICGQMGTEAAPVALPFGISEPYDAANAGSKRNTDIELANEQDLAFWRALDEKCLQEAIKNKDSWWGEKRGAKLTEADIRAMFRPIVKDDDPEYKPSLRTKAIVDPTPYQKTVKIYQVLSNDDPTKPKRVIPVTREIPYPKEGTPEFIAQEPIVAQKRREQIDLMMKVVPRRTSAVVIVELGSMWFMSKQFGLTVHITDILVNSDPPKPEFAFDLSGSYEVVKNEPPILMEEDDGANAVDPIAESDFGGDVQAEIQRRQQLAASSAAAPQQVMYEQQAPSRDDGNIDDDPMGM